MGNQKAHKLDCSLTFIFVSAIAALCATALFHAQSQVSASPRLNVSASDFESPSLTVAASDLEYLWYEAENMRGISENSRYEPVLNPSYLELPAAKAPGWGISGPGVSAEWSQGGESEWNSVNASADETRAAMWQDVEIPRA